MAIWDDGTINNNELRFVFNKLFQRKAVAMVRKKKGAFYALAGKPQYGKEDKGLPTFSNVRNITGKKVEVTLLGSLPAPAALARSAQLDSLTLTWDDDAFGGSQFGISQWPWTEPLPLSELDRYQGDEAKTESYLDDIFEKVMLGYEKQWNTALNTTGAGYNATEDVLGSLWYAIMGIDGAWTTNPDTYGDLNRQDSGNADFRGQYQGSVGNLTRAKMFSTILDCEAYGGNPSASSCGKGVYMKVNQLLEESSQVYVTFDEEWKGFKGKYLRYGNVVFFFDPDAPSGYMSLLTDDTWRLYMRKDVPFNRNGLVQDVTKKGQPMVLPCNVWMQLVCKHPAQNGVLAGITVD